MREKLYPNFSLREAYDKGRKAAMSDSNDECLGHPARYWYDAFRIAEGLRADAERRVQEMRGDAARYRKLVSQAVEGDWGQHTGWKLHVDIKGAPAIENIDDAIDAQFRLHG